jgi:hypothetical protein
MQLLGVSFLAHAFAEAMPQVQMPLFVETNTHRSMQKSLESRGFFRAFRVVTLHSRDRVRDFPD